MTAKEGRESLIFKRWKVKVIFYALYTVVELHIFSVKNLDGYVDSILEGSHFLLERADVLLEGFNFLSHCSSN
ncbi:hypothetical protein [Streptomyces sp. NPDC059970]|uniref:hypothetical protein n=1 Tax=Streptomyces sp. NPDC059970 TaxID=3347019 RepID=UPI003694F4B2